MRTVVLLALTVFFAGCSTPSTDSRPYAKANSLMQREISSRIANFKYQHGQELLNNMMWLESKAGETAITDLLEALENEDPKVRSSSIWVLGRIRDRRTIPDLQGMIKDQNEVVRLEAARSLVMMGDMVHVPTLIEGLDSAKTPVRYNCHMALRDATRKDFEYDHLEENSVQRRVAVLRWREWWSKQSSDPWFAASYARQHGLASETVKDTQPAAPAGETKPETDSTDEEVMQPKPTTPEPKKVDTNTEETSKDEDEGAVFKLLDLGGKSTKDTETKSEGKPEGTSETNEVTPETTPKTVTPKTSGEPKFTPVPSPK